jgi:type VI secretion system secreted protein VgrG
VKVQFHWDRDGQNDEGSSCWIRVAQPMSGRRWGTSFWPRIGQEVIVDFLEGDMDQPIIVGCVYNADQMPPYLGQGPDDKHKNDNKVSGFKSNTTQGGAGFNELRFDDTKDKEQVFIHSEKNLDVRVKNDSMEHVFHDMHLTVGGGYKGDEGGNYREKVFKDKHVLVKGNQDEKIEGNYKLYVGDGPDGGNFDLHVEKKMTQYVQTDSELKVIGSRKTQITGNDDLDVTANINQKAGANFAVEAGAMVHLKAGATFVIEAGAMLGLKVGGSFVSITPAGVFVSGPMVMINSGGAAGSGSGCSPASPGTAQKAAPIDPTEADDAKSGTKSC